MSLQVLVGYSIGPLLTSLKPIAFQALRKNPERKNPEFEKRENPERNNLEFKNLESEKIQRE